MIVNQAAFDVGRLSQRLAEGYYAYVAAIQIAASPKSNELIGETPPGEAVPVGYVTRKNGTRHTFHFQHYLDQARTNQAIVGDLPRAWLVGSLLAVGDALAKHSYFDRAPELELLRHLRNGIAHGNRFFLGRGNKLHESLARLAKYPAHNKLARVRGLPKTTFEIVGSLNGQPVLFDFMGPGDVLDLLMSIELYLTSMGTGSPLRP